MHKLLPALFILAALAPIYYADTPYSVTYFTSFIMPNQSSYFLDSTIFDNQTVYLILTNGKIISVMLPAQTAGKYSPTTDTKKIGEIMQSYYYSLGYTPQAAEGLSLAHEKILSIRDRRKSGEAECKRLAGTDHCACDTFESCKQSCMSCTPFCPNFANGGEPGEFIRVIWAFENNTRDLDSAYAAEGAAYAAFNSSRTATSMADYLSSISALNRAATKAASSRLYDYSFCAQPNYALSDLTTMQLGAQKDYLNSSRFISLPDDISAVVHYTISGMQKKFDYEFAFNKSMERNSTSNGTIAPAPVNKTSNESQPPAQPQNSYLGAGAMVPLFGGIAAVAAISGYLLFFREKKRL
jgi:hypothetical protein